ncbi:McrB family protein [Nostoc sp.]|uniref:McrB family protein n=2 Tax=Nostoc sp. TaxID=1180 RepID=UPI002FF4DACB
MNQKNILTWGDVAYASRIATVGSEQEWEALELIWQAWEIIIKAGLTTYSNKPEFLQVVIRFVAVVSFYLELLNEDNWQSYVYYYITEWIKAIKMPDDYLKYIIECVCSLALPLVPNSKLDSLLLYSVDIALQQVTKLLIDKLNSDSMLFKKVQKIKEEEFEDEYNLQRIDAELISNSILVEKIINLSEKHEDFYRDHKIIKYEIAIIEIFENQEYVGKIDLSDTDLNDFGYFEDFEQLQKVTNNDFDNLGHFEDFEQSQKVTDAANKVFKFFSLYQLKPKYSIKQISQETGFNETELKHWIRTINRKNQTILYGSPGTGKTFIAEHLGKHLIGGGDGFLELLQFHPTYSYEDFIQGIRPQSQDGQLTYPLLPGSFLKFCKEAEYHQGTCVLIIDEINRANLAQVFGELMYLLEYRDKEIILAGGNRFRIPNNVRIIGTMNTADRSIANIDHALRRRFAFIELRPNYDILRSYHRKRGFTVEGLINILQQLNQAIADKNYEIGISFFLTDNLREDIEDIWSIEIEPYLEEYFFNQLKQVDQFRWDEIKNKLWI